MSALCVQTIEPTSTYPSSTIDIEVHPVPISFNTLSRLISFFSSFRTDHLNA